MQGHNRKVQGFGPRNAGGGMTTGRVGGTFNTEFPSCENNWRFLSPLFARQGPGIVRLGTNLRGEILEVGRALEDQIFMHAAVTELVPHFAAAVSGRVQLGLAALLEELHVGVLLAAALLNVHLVALKMSVLALSGQAVLQVEMGSAARSAPALAPF